MRGSDGYLVIVDDKGIERLQESGLRPERIATDVDRGEMALEIRMDGSNRQRFPLLFEDEGIRLYRTDPTKLLDGEDTPGLASLPAGGLRVVYKESQPLDMGRLSQVMDLNAGEIVVIPPNLPHEALMIGDVEEMDSWAPPRQDWLDGTDHYLREG